jgi:YjbE family integral membrane protein
MSFMEMLQSSEFWIGLMKIIWVNLILSGDNAVVIALAARSLPPEQQRKAVLWGSGAAVGMRIVLTLFAVALLTLPYLKLVGAVLLLWIGVQLLTPDDGDENIASHDNLFAAIKTILIADLVMSLDNVIAVAAAAKGSVVLLILGLAISIPLVIFGSTLLLKLMERAPAIITFGAALLGYVAGEMAESDPASVEWVAANIPFHTIKIVPGLVEISLLGLLGAAVVVGIGKWMAGRKAPRAEKGHA